MTRTHNMAHIKQRIAEKALREEEARAAACAAEAHAVQNSREAKDLAEAVRRTNVQHTRTRSKKTAILPRQHERRAQKSAIGFGLHALSGDEMQDDEEEVGVSGDEDSGEEDCSEQSVAEAALDVEGDESSRRQGKKNVQSKRLMMTCWSPSRHFSSSTIYGRSLSWG